MKTANKTDLKVLYTLMILSVIIIVLNVVLTLQGLSPFQYIF